MSQNWKLLVLGGLLGICFMQLFANLAIFSYLHDQDAALMTLMESQKISGTILRRLVPSAIKDGKLKVVGDPKETMSVQGVNPVQTKDLMIPEYMSEHMSGVLLVKIVGDERVWEMRPRVRKR